MMTYHDLSGFQDYAQIMQDLAGPSEQQIACFVVGICSSELAEVAERRHTAALPANSFAAWLRKPNPES